MNIDPDSPDPASDAATPSRALSGEAATPAIVVFDVERPDDGSPADRASPRAPTPMRVHFDVLGWLYIVCGAFGVLTGFSLGVLASGTHAAIDALSVLPAPANPTVWLFILSAVLFVAGGVALMGVGRAIVRRSPLSRQAALVAAAPVLLIAPFGTALGVYTFWALLNDDARREFGAPSIQSMDGPRR